MMDRNAITTYLQSLGIVPERWKNGKPVLTPDDFNKVQQAEQNRMLRQERMEELSRKLERERAVLENQERYLREQQKHEDFINNHVKQLRTIAENHIINSGNIGD